MTKALADQTDTTRSVVDALYTALGAGDFAALGELFSGDLVVRQPPYLPWGGTYRTPAAVMEVAGSIAEHLDMTQMTVDRILADGDTAVGLLRFADRRTGESVVVAEQLTVHEGKITEARLYYHDTQAVPLTSGPPPS